MIQPPSLTSAAPDGLRELLGLYGETAMREAIAAAGLDRPAVSADTQTPEERALIFVFDLLRGSRRTATTRALVLRHLLNLDYDGLACIAAHLGVSRVRVVQIRDVLAARLASRGVRVRARERLTP